MDLIPNASRREVPSQAKDLCTVRLVRDSDRNLLQIPSLCSHESHSPEGNATTVNRKASRRHSLPNIHERTWRTLPDGSPFCYSAGRHPSHAGWTESQSSKPRAAVSRTSSVDSVTGRVYTIKYSSAHDLVVGSSEPQRYPSSTPLFRQPSPTTTSHSGSSGYLQRLEVLRPSALITSSSPKVLPHMAATCSSRPGMEPVDARGWCTDEDPCSVWRQKIVGRDSGASSHGPSKSQTDVEVGVWDLHLQDGMSKEGMVLTGWGEGVNS